MADAPKTGGGGWTALEIIVVLILAIGLLDRISGKPITPLFDSSSTKPASQKPALDYTNPYCGLSISSPKSNALVTTSIALVGTVHGCNWLPNGTVALNAQVIDANGLPLTDYLNIPSTTKTDTATNFASVIALTAPSPTHSGYLILIPATPKQIGESTSVRIPLQFVR
jgi:hypothetical protein